MQGDETNREAEGGATAGPDIRTALNRLIQRHLAEAGERILEDCVRLTADAGANVERLMGAIMTELSRVREEFHEHRTARQRLEQMQAQKLFAFSNGIDPQSFRILCAIIANGTVAKAAKALGLEDSTVRSRVKRWRKRGPDYKVLVDLVRWRKAMGIKATVPIPLSVLKSTAAQVDFPGLLSDVLDELLSMDQANWPSKADTLAELLRPYVER